MAAPHPGLCKTCTFARPLQNDRGSSFWLCEAHKTFPDLPRYPSLPVTRCPAFSPLQPDVKPAHIERLSPALRGLLDAELAAGNEIVETWQDWPPGAVFVMLKKPFLSRHIPLPAGVVYRAVNDPHYWTAEYEHEGKNQFIGCR